MKKIFTLASLATILTIPVTVLAQGDLPVPQVSSLQQIIHAIENAMGTVFGGIAVICFLVAGILFLTAGGSPEKVQMARSAFIWGVVGVVVGLISFSIVAIVGSVLR